VFVNIKNYVYMVKTYTTNVRLAVRSQIPSTYSTWPSRPHNEKRLHITFSV